MKVAGVPGWNGPFGRLARSLGAHGSPSTSDCFKFRLVGLKVKSVIGVCIPGGGKLKIRITIGVLAEIVVHERKHYLKPVDGVVKLQLMTFDYSAPLDLTRPYCGPCRPNERLRHLLSSSLSLYRPCLPFSSVRGPRWMVPHIQSTRERVVHEKKRPQSTPLC